MFQMLVEQLPAVVYRDSADGQTAVYVSPQVETIFGITPEAWNAPADSEAWDLAFIHPDDRDALQAGGVLQAEEEGRGYTACYRLRCGDGSYRWITDTAAVTLDGMGVPLFRHGVICDISAIVGRHEFEAFGRTTPGPRLEQLSAAALLADTERRHRLLIEQMPAVTYVDDASSGDPLYISPQIEQLVGFTVEEWMSDPEFWMGCIHPEDRARVLNVWTRERAHGSDHGGPYRLIHRDGSVVWVEDRSAELVEAAEGRSVVQGVMLDITAQKQVEAALAAETQRRREAVSKLIRVTEDERARIANELHDDTIQVMAATLMLLDSAASAVERAAPERALESVRRARGSLGLAVERARRLMFELRPPLLERSGLAVAIRELLEQAGDEVGFASSIEAEVGRLPRAAEDLAYYALREAVSNVRKHAGATLVQVALAEQDGMLTASVTDDGCGFDLERALDRTRMRLHLGLDALRERIELAGGTLRIATAPGAGTTVGFSIPVREPEPAPDPGPG